MELIDTHCHLDLPQFDADRSAVLARSRRNGVCGIVVPGIAAGGWPGLLELCAAHADLYPALGMHPVFIGRHRTAHLTQLEQLAKDTKPIAIGEIGLDYYIHDLDRTTQQRWFEAQLEVARLHALPVLLHVRKAHDQVLDTLRRIRVVGGIAHAFNGSLEQAGRYLDLGFKLGFGGMLTYQRSTRLRKLGQALPIDALVLETDAPDMTVASHRGERNSPEYLPECLRALAAARGEDPEEVAARTTCNAHRVLALR